MRKFAHVAGYEHVPLPTRATLGSAGYDLTYEGNIARIIYPGEVTTLATGVKAIFSPDEVLLVYLRSSIALVRGLILANGVGVVDSDYCANHFNDGHIAIIVRNVNHVSVTIEPGDHIAQAIFTKFLVTDDDDVTSERTGGFGSTGR